MKVMACGPYYGLKHRSCLWQLVQTKRSLSASITSYRFYIACVTLENMGIGKNMGSYVVYFSSYECFRNL